MNNGWIKLHRQIEEWEWATDPFTAYLFLRMVAKANYATSRWKGIVFERGQLLGGRNFLANLTGIPTQCVRTSLQKLKISQQITIKSTNRYSIITIVNYDKYQDLKNDQPANQPVNDLTTNQQLTSNQPLYKKDKKKKNEKKDRGEVNSPTPSAVCREFFTDESIQENWQQRLVAKGVAIDTVVRELKKFRSYWTEKNKSGTKERWQLQKTFELNRRLSTWMNNVSKFSS